MSELTLSKIRLQHGQWEGRLTSPGGMGLRPDIQVTWADRPIEGVTLRPAEDGSGWDLLIRVPPEALAEGVQTFLISDSADGSRLGAFSLILGEPAADDLRAEVELLRAELDLLKRAFRRHCVETA